MDDRRDWHSRGFRTMGIGFGEYDSNVDNAFNHRKNRDVDESKAVTSRQMMFFRGARLEERWHRGRPAMAKIMVRPV